VTFHVSNNFIKEGEKFEKSKSLLKILMTWRWELVLWFLMEKIVMSMFVTLLACLHTSWTNLLLAWFLLQLVAHSNWSPLLYLLFSFITQFRIWISKLGVIGATSNYPIYLHNFGVSLYLVQWRVNETCFSLFYFAG
jgi:hypothetical protein